MIYLLGIVIFLLISFFFNVVEMTLENLDSADLEAARRHSPGLARKLELLYRHPARLFSAVTTGIVLSHQLAGVLFTYYLDQLNPSSGVRVFIVTTYTVLVAILAEAVPQLLGVRHGRRVYRAIVPITLLWVRAVGRLAGAWEALLRVPPFPQLRKRAPAREEVQVFLEAETARHFPGLIRLLRTASAPVGRYTRRVRKEALPEVRESWRAIAERLSGQRETRLLCRDGRRVAGYIHVLDLLRAALAGEHWEAGLQRPLQVRPETRVAECLQSMRRERKGIAVTAADGEVEYVTLNDLRNLLWRALL